MNPTPAPLHRWTAFAAVLCLLLRTTVAQAAPPPERASGMSLAQATLLGLIEGLTEYLPVSSTGHLLLAQRMMGLGRSADQKTAADAYAVCIQAGAILAVAGLYFRRLTGVARGLVGRDADGLRLGRNLIVAFVPAAIAGLTLEKFIKHQLFGAGQWGLWPIVGAWLVGGAVILLVDHWLVVHGRRHTGRDLVHLTWPFALLIGVIQCTAMWPGVSRSLATIIGGLLAGLSIEAAVEFSFLLGLVTLSASTALDGLEHGRTILALYGWVTPLVGALVALVAAVAAVRWMVTYLHRHPIAIFGWYRIALALAASAVLLWR